MSIPRDTILIHLLMNRLRPCLRADPAGGPGHCQGTGEVHDRQPPGPPVEIGGIPGAECVFLPCFMDESFGLTHLRVRFCHLLIN